MTNSVSSGYESMIYEITGRLPILIIDLFVYLVRSSNLEPIPEVVINTFIT